MNSNYLLDTNIRIPYKLYSAIEEPR